MSDQRYLSIEKTLLCVISSIIILLSGFSWAKIISENYAREETFVEQKEAEETQIIRIGNSIVILSGIGTAFIFRSDD